MVFAISISLSLDFPAIDTCAKVQFLSKPQVYALPSFLTADNCLPRWPEQIFDGLGAPFSSLISPANFTDCLSGLILTAASGRAFTEYSFFLASCTL